MEELLNGLIGDFLNIRGARGRLTRDDLVIDFQPEPHRRPSPLRNERAVYLFFRGEDWLRIGQTGYSARFTSQHYGTRRAGSTFAMDLWTNRLEFGFNGNEANIDQWIWDNFGRANIRMSAEHGAVMSQCLEAFLHLNLRSRFEGARQPPPDQV